MAPAPSPKESIKTCPDDVLVERARARDEAAFRELVCRHGQDLRYLVSRFVDTTSDQEDVLQNALLNAWRFLPAFEGRAKFSSWMHRVTVNSALMLVRGDRRKREAAVGDVEEWTRTEGASVAGDPHCGFASCWIQRPDEALQSSELRALLTRLVGGLPPRLQKVFVLRYMDGLSIKETAATLGLQESATKTRLHRACQTLRAAIHRNADDLAVCQDRRVAVTSERSAA
jgi:RNA polymerase sigma-70 factor (ECF subfamily)